MRILVSACLLGACCRYDGRSKPCESVLALRGEHELIPVCPEQLGGLPTPRPPCEWRAGRAVTQSGEDKTEAYLRGAREALRLYALLGCSCAILKARSPMCGLGSIYDGTFTGALTEGEGALARLLRESGAAVYDETALPDMTAFKP